MITKRRGWWVVLGALVLLFLASTPWAWTELAARGHEFTESGAPAADVVIVLGTEVRPDGTPGDRLTGRLETAAALVQAGKARVVLLSGDGGGASGDEPAAMARHLTGLGVDPRRIVADPHGLDTYDSCRRARDVYGLDRALVVTQAYHLSRAVTLCRAIGLDASGVPARCPGCPATLLAEKSARDYLASGKAAWDALRGRPPAVESPPSGEVRDALAGG
ncbi:SanA/YdcF family protein [Paractinoplanes rishiriensis]|uniref:SanA/YdcF family protein n=1 Tax=Paractinoplanes rishiriensis TaxID=1050105 RepID=UPI001EF218C8|nr:ElyC/SanA/YdcF family protein [Actinoplanes rishiriensis]